MHILKKNLIFFSLVFSFILPAIASAALSSNVAAVCNPPDVGILRMYSASGNHAELPSQSFYPKILCASGVSGISSSCASPNAVTVLRLSGVTNAHVEENTQGNYANNTCLGISSGTVSVGYQNNNCTGFDTTLASISGFTNAHIGDANAYTLKVCASAAATLPPPPPPNGGGGGSGGSSNPNVLFSGRAYPGSIVTLLKDGQIAAQTIAGPDSNFGISLSGLSAGYYSFSLYGEDNNHVRSSLFTFPVMITLGATVTVGGIFIAPTISTDKSEVKKGDNIAIFGQAAQNADVTISVHSSPEMFVNAKSDKSGIYLYNLDTAPLDNGQHLSKSKATIGNEISAFGKTVSFLVGTKNVYASSSGTFLKGDLNSDGHVNLVDFSIAAYWYKRTLSNSFKQIEKDRLNGDVKIDITDFSIMAYYWTG